MYGSRWLRRQGPVPNGGEADIPTYHSDTIWGNVFCQGFKVGLASYHFIPPAEGEDMGTAYISYENPATSEWPPLDNGQPIPAKVKFHNISFPNATTFRGQILWQQDYGTPWQGMVRWEYEMIFDEKFTCIIGGSVTSFNADTPEVPRELSRYGEGLVYVNAALYNEFRRQVLEEQEATTTERNNNQSSSDNTGEESSSVQEDWSDRFHRQSLELRLRLQHENAPVRVIAMAHRLMTFSLQDVCPIDYNIRRTGSSG